MRWDERRWDKIESYNKQLIGDDVHSRYHYDNNNNDNNNDFSHNVKNNNNKNNRSHIKLHL